MPEQQPDDGPSLELPSFGLRRRRRRGRKQEPAAEAELPPAATPEPTTDVDVWSRDEPPAPAPEPEPAKVGPRRPSLPGIGGSTAAVVTGAIVGVLMVGATWASLRFCELVQGTSSCGNPGFFLLLAVTIVVAWLGRLLLSAFEVPEPGSTSFLGVGLIAVISLLFFVDLLFNPWMIVVIPAVGMAAYSLSHWVTVTFVGADPGDSMHR